MYIDKNYLYCLSCPVCFLYYVYFNIEEDGSDFYKNSSYDYLPIQIQVMNR